MDNTTISNILKSAIDDDYKKLRETFTFESYYALHILIRRLDEITKYAPQAREINEICVFVFAGNHIHFTGVKTDERVAWGSWYQLIEALASIETKFDDPIKEMFVKLNFFAPEQRMTREEMPTRQHFDAKIGDYWVYYADEDK